MTRFQSIECDNPDCEGWRDTLESADDIETDAANAGWLLGPPDYCPDCRPTQLRVVEGQEE
jgi:hypothetical protein